MCFNINLTQRCGGDDQTLGYDKVTGICKCKVQDLEQVCDASCRSENKLKIQLVCSYPENYLKVTDNDGILHFYVSLSYP